MADVIATTASGGEAILGEAMVTAFGSRLRGELLRPEHRAYEGARRVWNGMIDKRPALIVRCADVNDVVSAVRLAREQDLLVSVRGGGHNIAGKSMCDGGLVIDLSPMNRVEVDPAGRTARVEGGALLGDLDRETQAFGLATTAGVVTHTGVGGLTLGGGVGRLARKHGLACDNVLAVELVTAAGAVLNASAAENADLFWGLRGGGGNFGIVTAFHFRLHPVGPQVLGGKVLYPLQQARAALEFYLRFSRTAADELSADAIFLTSPAGERVLAVSVCYAGPIAEGERVLQPLRRFGTPLLDDIAPLPYREVQAAADAFFPTGLRFYWKSHFIRDMDRELVEASVDHFARSPSPQSLLVFQQFGGRVGGVARSDTAFWHRDVQWDNFAVSVWTDPAETAPHLAWVRQWWDSTRRFSLGGEYINNLGDEGNDRVRAAYGGNYERLVGLKQKYDPGNFFRLNANIRPG